MGSVVYQPPPGKAEAIDVTVGGSCVYTLFPGVPQYIPAEHFAAVRAAIDRAGGVIGGASPTPTLAVIGTAGVATWTYKIVPVNDAGIDSAQSAAGTTGAVANATLTVGNLNRLTWTAVPDAVTYKVIRFSSGGTPAGTGTIGQTSALTLDDNGTVAGAAYVAATGDSLGASPTPTAAVVGAGGATTWTYQIVPFNAQGVDGSVSASGSTGTLQAATLTAANRTHVTWALATGAAGYKVNRATSGGTPAGTGTIGIVPTGGVLAFDDDGTQAGVAYVAVTIPTFGTGTGPAEI